MAESINANTLESYDHADSQQHGSAPDREEVEAGGNDVSADADVVTPLASETETLLRGDTHLPLAGRLRSESDSQQIDTASPTTALSPATAAASSGQTVENSTGTYGAAPLRPSSSRRSLRTHNASTQSSSGSLQTLAEQESQDIDAGANVKRTASTRVRQTPPGGRRHSKSASMSQPITNFRRLMNNEHPVYPEQSLASLSPAVPSYNQRPHILRSRSSHPTQNLLYGDMNNSYATNKDRLGLPQLARTADNTPMASPGLFTATSDFGAHEPLRPTTPTLHHLQTPKETHAAEIDHDGISGNKILNDYEMVSLIGRGEFGKVKLGRHMKTGEWVAIKIVPRYSKIRRLGRIGEPQDQTKREIAILKKARHPNVVSLLEVIDDPSRNKVYLILEYVEKGEIKWRRRGVKEIVKINNARFQQESEGISMKTDIIDHEKWMIQGAIIRQKGLEKARLHQPHSSSVAHYYPAWDIEEESEELYRIASLAPSIAASLSHSATPSDSATPSRTPSQDDYAKRENIQQLLAGSMYGPYADESTSFFPERKYSIATAPSHMSSEFNFESVNDEELTYVPTLKLHDAKEAFRQTLLGLEFLHAVGIIHRDIKPSNLLLGVEDVVKISDFGVSYFGPSLTVQFPSDQEVKSMDVREEDAKPLDDERELARSVGTPGFWAPELCYMDTNIFLDNKQPKITGAIDLWALGITLYAMVYARLPFYATEDIGLHAAICTMEPVIPSTRLVPVDTHLPELTLESKEVRSGMRVDWDLKFENVPADLRDLISKLLIKDPAQRITIADVKQHPWVLKDLEDPMEFLKEPEVLKMEEQEPLTVNDDDISTAVTKRSIYTEMQKGVKALVNAFKGATGRKRGVSTSSNTAASNSSESINSPHGSTTSTVGKVERERGREARRTSLHTEELLNALNRHREISNHPLAQSQTASPDNQELPSYFPEQPPPSVPSTESSPSLRPELDRPKLPERAVSALSTLSTADSVRTIRASQVNPQPALDLPIQDERAASMEAANTRARTAGLWEGASKRLSRLTSRERWTESKSRSPSASRSSTRNEARTGPSLALSNTHASGSIEAPDALRALDTRSDVPSRPGSLTSSPIVAAEHQNPNRDSGDDEFDRAQEINHRRHIQEAQQAAEEASNPPELQESVPTECPPSPDDLTFKALESRSPGASTISPLDQGLGPAMRTAASSVDDFSSSSVTQSTSNPSFVATSGASSPPDEEFISAEYRDHYYAGLQNIDRKPDFMRTADTVIQDSKTQFTKPSASILEQQGDYCEGDDEDSEDDDDGVIMMGGSRK